MKVLLSMQQELLGGAAGAQCDGGPVRRMQAGSTSTSSSTGTSQWLIDAMTPVMRWRYNGSILAHHMLHANVTHESAHMRKMIEDMQTWNISKWTADLDKHRLDYLASDWPRMLTDAAKRVDEELDKLRVDLDSPVGTHTKQVVEDFVDELCGAHIVAANTPTSGAWNSFNATKLAHDLEDLKKALDGCGIKDWINNTNGSNIWRPLRDAMGSMTEEDILNMTKEVAKWLHGTDAEGMAESADHVSWWLSHFTRSHSALSRFIGEEPWKSWNMDWASVNFKVENFASESVAVPTSLHLSTAMADAIFRGLKTWQQVDAQNVSHHVQKEWDKMSDWIDDLGMNVSDHVMPHLQKVVDDLYGHDVTGIEQILLPRWNSTWPAQCKKTLNKTRITIEVEKMRARCPFYRNSVKHLADRNISKDVEDLHKELNSWNGTGKTCPFLESAQKNLVKHVDASKVESDMKEMMSRYQAKVLEQPQAMRDDDAELAHEGATAIVNMMTEEIDNYLEKDSNGVVRRLQKGGAQRYDSVTQELLCRKILVAPFKGEAKELIRNMFVEVAHSMTTSNDNTRLGDFPPELRALMRCPLVKAAVAMGADYFMKDRMLTFDTEKALEDYARDNGKKVLLAIVFRNADPATGNFPSGDFEVDYSIRAHAQFLPRTSRILRLARNAMMGGVRRTFYPYIDTFYVHLQENLGRAVARMRASRGVTMPGMNFSEVGRHISSESQTREARRLALAVQQFPAPGYKVDRFIRVIQHTMPMFMILGWIYAVSLLVKEMVYEKQEKLRDVMRIQGLKTWVYWASWMASAMIQMTVLTFAITAILCGGQVLKKSDPSLVFAFLWVYSLATVSLSMFISSFFSRAKVAAACAGLIYYVLYLPYALFNRFEDVMSPQGKNAMCLISSTAMGIGSAIMAKWELIEEGVNWSNWAQPPPVTNSGATPKDEFSLANVMGMLLIDSLIYQVLAWYIEKVRPGTLGLPQPWYFPVLPSYWRGPSELQSSIEDDDSKEPERTGNDKLECWEAAAEDLSVAVKIRGLVKTFSGGKKALKGINLDMHRGTILGLLGHNGAGKTTTMAILTGLYPPTAGDVQVNGRSVRKDSHGVRQQLGVCLQQNALYEWISVEEHLSLFCCLKSVPWSQMQATVEGLLTDTGLMFKRTAPSKALSGGMKRKLSIGIALSGGSQVVALDEPTAGVDATSRRDIWQLLAAQKTKRTILLSTHFMDEADILSDRIAIIAEGSLTAIGGGMTLKRHYADSYMLTIVEVDGAETRRITKAVQEAVPEVKYIGCRGRELSYSLPGNARGNFSALFAKLQDVGMRATLGIDTYGLSAATMEEVFLQASSVHEEGLAGSVRTTQVDATDGDESASVEGPPSDEISTTSGSSSANNSKSSNGLSGGNSGSDLEGRQVTPPDETGPQSPHSMITQKPIVSETANNIVPSADQSLPEEKRSHSTEKVKKEKVSAMDSKTVEKEMQPMNRSQALWHGPKLWRQQYGALIRKRALSVRRDRMAWISQLLLPAGFVFLALIVAAILQAKEDEPALMLNTDMFIGTTQAGRAAITMEENVIPWADLGQDAYGKQMYEAFDQVKGAHDVLSKEAVGPGFQSENMSHYLMENTKALLMTTYGAAEVGGTQDVRNVTMWFRARAYHAVPVFTNLFNNARFRMLGYTDTKLNAWNHPLPKSQAVMEEEMSSNNQAFVDLTVAITVLLAMGFIPASFVVYLVHEKASSGKHQQLLTGVSPTMYWLSSYCWDILNYLCPLIICFLIFVVFNVDAYSGRNAPAIFMLLLSYGVCMTPAMYCLEPLFSVPSTAYVCLICLNIFTGTISVMATAVLDMVQEEEKDLKPINVFFKAVFPWILPNYSLGRGMIDIATNHYQNYAYDEFGVCLHEKGTLCIRNPMVYDVVGRHLMCLFLMTPAWLGLRMFIEWGCCTRKLRKGLAMQQGVESSTSPDEAVQKEAERITAAMTNGKPSDSLILTNLAKTFRKQRACCCRRRVPATRAVRGLNVGVPGGECFGLLGVNGAGKTTAMRMITGDTDIGGGDIQVCGFSVQNQRDRARWHLGYCPQFDALPDKLTVRETLALYARIRGVPAYTVAQTVEEMVQRMCLEAHQNNTCEHLSGGNKRKLSTALALIGEPDVVLLDEPSTGVDVGARRFLWEVIGDIRKRGHALVLTSHSMEECEVLCTRLTIMSHGQLRCLGTPTQLKARYGGGYTLMVKAILSKDVDSCSRIRDWVPSNVPGALLAEESVGLFRYGLGGRGSDRSNDVEVPLASIFETFEQATKEGGELHGCVSDYTLSQTSLEEVFLHFSQEAEAIERGEEIPQAPRDVDASLQEPTVDPPSLPVAASDSVTDGAASI
jgi:ABC-type multidrug transport system ATPase subunit